MRKRTIALVAAPIALLLLAAALLYIRPSKHEPNGALRILDNGKRFTVSLTSGTRTGALYVPDSFPTEGAALILVVHGMGGNGEATRSYGFDTWAEKLGFIVAYPDGQNGGWSSFEDNAFIGWIIDGIAARYGIDKNKVFLTGPSLGAIQCHETAIVWREDPRHRPIAGPISADSVRLTVTIGPMQHAINPKPTSVLMIHALDDAVIPYDGKYMWGIYSVAETLAFWKRVNDCHGAYSDYDSEPFLDARLWSGEQADCAVITSLEGGHAWPPTPRNESSRSFYAGNDAHYALYLP
jgi:poly(3-hydroxybutyrate) depolymerase